MSSDLPVAIDPRLVAGRARAAVTAGWRTLYTRGYSLRSPPEFARDWMVAHLPFQAQEVISAADCTAEVLASPPTPVLRVSFRRSHLVRLTEWNLRRPGTIVAIDYVWKGQRLELVGREEHRFMGNANGSIVEVTVSRKPISLASRLGFGLFPMMSGVPVAEETAIFDAVDRAFLTRQL